MLFLLGSLGFAVVCHTHQCKSTLWSGCSSPPQVILSLSPSQDSSSCLYPLSGLCLAHTKGKNTNTQTPNQPTAAGTERTGTPQSDNSAVSPKARPAVCGTQVGSGLSRFFSFQTQSSEFWNNIDKQSITATSTWMEANTSRVWIVSEKSSQRTSSARATCTAKTDIWKWLSVPFQDICELQRASHSPSPLSLRKFNINLAPFESTSKLEASPSAVFSQVTNGIKSTRNTHSGLAHFSQTMVIQDRRDTRFTVML